jgi:hypothetical protein
MASTRLQRLRRGGVSETFPFAGPTFRRAAPWLLAAVAFVGLIARAFPALRWAVWGSDSGEYDYLTRQLADTGRILFTYHGWGLAYPYFPGMFVVSAAAHDVLGVDLFHATQWTVPILGATMPPLVALLAFRVTGDPRVAVVAGSFVAVTSLVTVTTSHAMPGTVGQVLFLGMLALLPEAHRDRLNLPLLMLLGVGVVLSHHLTAYFAIGTLAFIPFYRELTQRQTDGQRLRVEIPLGLFLLALALVWWLLVATPFRDEIVGQALPLPVWATAILFLLMLAALPALVILKKQRVGWYLGPRYPPFPRQRALVATTAIALWLVVAFISLVKLPGSSIRVSPIALLYVLPVLGFLAFLPPGHAMTRFHKHGAIVLGFLYAVLASLAFAIATNSHVLFPFRHVDYMAMAMATPLALGMVMLYDQTIASRIPVERPRTRGSFVTAFTLLVAVSLLLAYPPREALGGFEEGIGDEELAAVQWVADHHDVVPINATFAADHRDSSLLWGLAGVDPTWDYTPQTYHADDAAAALAELEDAKVPALGHARVDYVLLTPEIEQGVTLTQWENAAPMSEKAIAKFDNATLFEKLYDQDGARIYRINWTAADALAT